MRKYTKYTLAQTLILCLFSLFSCQEKEDMPLSDEDFIQFSFNRQVFTRASMEEDGSGDFTEGDRIGLYIEQKAGTYRHIVLTRESGTWLPRLKKSDLGEGLVTLNAYYPVCDDIQDEIPNDRHRHSVSNDQQAEGYEASDLLWAKKTVSAGSIAGNRIEMSFGHALHRLVVEFESGEELPEDMEVSVCGKTEGTVYLFNGEVTPSESQGAEWIKTRKLGDGRYCAVFYPQKLKQGEEWVKITIGDKEPVCYKAPASVGGSSSLVAGKQTTLKLTVKGQEAPDSEWAGRKQWVYGVSAPVFPDNPDEIRTYYPGSPENFPSGQWFGIQDYTKQFLNWEEGCGWFDADKIKATPGGVDANMCWAGSASSLLHWWMFHNRDYIAAYDERYGSNTSGTELDRPSYAYDGWANFEAGETDSPIFDYFRTVCNNNFGNERSAINWFIRGGIAANVPSKEKYYDMNGYFGQVFAEDAMLAVDEKGLYKESFNRMVKDALANDKGIGFSLEHYTGVAHAMSVWGAEFDETGYVSAIYYVDNNDNDDFYVQGSANSYQRHRCIREEIAYSRQNKDGSREEGVFVNKKMVISLTTVDLGHDTWQKAFPEIHIR